MSKTVSQNSENLLLGSLPEDLRESILSLSKPVNLPVQSMLHEQGEMPSYAYFIRSGIVSLVVTMPEGGSAEVGLVGREGLIGAMHLLGPTPTPAQCFVQVEATALRIRMDDLRKLFLANLIFRSRVLEFIQQQNATLEQIAACNRLHEAEFRLARWLMMARDRADADTMLMTQEFLADMLGTRRTTVTLVAGNLQRRGLIEYKRGKVTITDRAGLEQAACNCYRVAKDAMDSLYK